MFHEEITSVEDSYKHWYVKPRINSYRAASVKLIEIVRLALMPPAVHRPASTATTVLSLCCTLDFTNSGDREASKGNEQLTFRHRASCILGQAFRYSPVNAFYIFNQHIYFII